MDKKRDESMEEIPSEEEEDHDFVLAPRQRNQRGKKRKAPMDRPVKRTYNARPALKTCCQPGAMKKCAALLQRHQRCAQVMNEAGFAVIFEGEDVVVSRNLIDHLVRYWDEEAKVFNIKGRTLHFTEQEVALITGLPAKGERVEVLPSLTRRPEGQFFRKYFAARRADIPHIEEMIDKLSAGELKMEEEDIARMIICLLFSTVLFPHSTRAVHPSLYRYIDDLPRLRSYNWAGAIHKMLVSGITHTSRLVGARSQVSFVARVLRTNQLSWLTMR